MKSTQIAHPARLLHRWAEGDEANTKTRRKAQMRQTEIPLLRESIPSWDVGHA
jgi:hypothetical protein